MKFIKIQLFPQMTCISCLYISTNWILFLYNALEKVKECMYNIVEEVKL